MLTQQTHGFQLLTDFSSLKTQCYWLDINASSRSTAEFESSIDDEESEEESLDGEAIFAEEKRLSSKNARLVDWNTECLFQLLKQVAVSRECVVQDDPDFLVELDKVKRQLWEFVRNIALM